MSDWIFETVHRERMDGFSITSSHPKKGDAFSPYIPSDRLKTLNWSNTGDVRVYSADMDFIGVYGRGERMAVNDFTLDHLAYNKCVLVADTDPIEYYCLTPIGDHYMDGEVFELLPDEERQLTGLLGKHIFVSDGELILPAAYEKHFLLSVTSVDTTTIKAGPEGAVIAVFYKLV